MNSGTKSKPVRTKEKPQYLQVFVRVRPPNASEKSRGLSVVHCSTNEVIVKDRQDHKVIKTFLCDRVFDQNSSQVEVYNHVIKPAVEDILKGFNYTVFAYGQSGSGKTYTIGGDRSPEQDISWDDDPKCGLMPRALIHLFDELRLLQAEFTIRVSHLELGNEEITDLLSRTGDSSKLRLYEDGNRKGTAYVHGLEEEVLHTRRDIHNILQKCMAQRISSRFHTVFTATVHIKENSMDGDELVRTAKLCLVDLAASENASRSAAAEKSIREAGNMNHSLLTLGRVITALVERAPHVPYRESKLTRLLRDALSGKSRTSIIGTVSPSAVNLDESLNTLEFIHRARNIVIRPEVNPKLTKESLIKEYIEEIERLKRDLEACHTKQGVYLLNEDYTQMVSDTTRVEREISEKLAAIRILNEQIQDKRRLCEELNIQLDEIQSQSFVTRAQLRAQLRQRDETQHLLERHKQTEECLSSQADVLLQVVDETTCHLDALHTKLDRTRCRTCENDNKRREVSCKFSQGMLAAGQEVGDLVQTFSASCSRLGEDTSSILQSDVPLLSAIRDNLYIVDGNKQKGVAALEEIVNEVGMAVAALINKAADTSTDTSALDAIMQDYALNVLPCLQDVHAQLQSCSVKTVDMYKYLECKNMEQIAWICKSLEQQEDTVLCLCEDFVKEVERRQVVKQVMFNLNRDLKERQNQSNMELRLKVGELQKALRGAAVQGSEYRNIIAGARDDHQQEFEVINKTDSRIANDLTEHQRTDLQLLAEMKGRIEQLVLDLKEALNQAKAATTHICAKLATTSNNVVGLSTAGSAAWTQHSEHLRTDVTSLCERLDAGLREEENTAFQVCSATAKQTRTCIEQVELLQRQAPTCVGGLIDRLQSQSAHMSSWSTMMASRLQNSAEEILLLSEDFVKDQPTGKTPERKEYEYPKSLKATSPHTKILEEFRPSRKNIDLDRELLDSSCEATSEESNLVASSADECEGSPHSLVSSTRAVSGSEPDLSILDKENIRAAGVQSASKLQQKVMHAFKMDVCKQILSPRN